MKIGSKVIVAVVIVVVIVAAAAYVLVSGLKPATPKVFRVGAVLPGDVTDLDWNQSLHEALQRLQQDPNYSVTEIDGIYGPVDAAPHFRAYAEAGYDLIIGHGFNYLEIMNEISQDYPSIPFLLLGGAKMPENAPQTTSITST